MHGLEDSAYFCCFGIRNTVPVSAANQGYFSAVSSSHSRTTSGPLSTLQRLANPSPASQTLRQARTPIHGPYRAKHVYNEPCLEEFVQPYYEVQGSYESNSSVISSYTGELFSALKSLHLIEVALEEFEESELIAVESSKAPALRWKGWQCLNVQSLPQGQQRRIVFWSSVHDSTKPTDPSHVDLPTTWPSCCYEGGWYLCFCRCSLSIASLSLIFKKATIVSYVWLS